jgi:hypothetical protein
MKASELRIGNYVMIKNELLPNYKNQPLIVTSIQQRNDRDFPNSKSVISCYVDKYNSVSQFDEFIRPIPLTEDIVIDLGLNAVELENGEWFYQNSKFRLNKNYAGFYYSKNLNIKYVHQLQNLYFALTGEELTIKE